MKSLPIPFHGLAMSSQFSCCRAFFQRTFLCLWVDVAVRMFLGSFAKTASFHPVYLFSFQCPFDLPLLWPWFHIMIFVCWVTILFNAAKIHHCNLFAVIPFSAEQPRPTGVENVFPSSLRNSVFKIHLKTAAVS